MRLSAKIRGKKKKTNVLLKEGKVPGVLYGPEIENLSLEIDEKKLEKTLKKIKEESFINLEINGKNFLVVIKEIQRDPIKGKIIHIDFYKPPLK